MAVYRFRICLEDHEDIWREIDILSTQVFETLHTCIQKAFLFDGKHAASFFLSDDQWRKGREVTLREEDLPLDESDVKAGVLPKKLMRDVKLAAGIKQPRQRFVYVFDPQAKWTFYIELIKLETEQHKTTYPVISNTNGIAPKQYKQVQMAKAELGPELAIAGLVDALSDEPDDEAIYRDAGLPDDDGVNADELDQLEGEEGDVDNEEDSETSFDDTDHSDYSFEPHEEE